MTFDALLIPTDGSDPADAAAARGFGLAAQLDAIAIGASGRGGFKRAIVGSVTDTVVRTATVPVLIVRAGTSDSLAADGRGGNE